MYTINMNRNKYVTVLKDGKEIEAMAGLYVTRTDLVEIKELIRLANKAEAREQKKECFVCRGRGFNVDWNKNHIKCSTCNGTGVYPA